MSSAPGLQFARANRLREYLDVLISDPSCLRGQMLRGGGPVREFEDLLALRTGFPYALATCNATTAIFVAVRALQLRSKIIVHNSTAWAGTLSSIRLAGANPQFHEHLNPSSSVECSAILGSDGKSNHHDPAGIRDLCDSRSLFYIEDTNRLPGVTVDRQDLSIADVQILSFGPGKPVCLGEGGLLLCRDPQVYARAVAISQHPERCITEKITIQSPGPVNGRINPLAALVGLIQLSE